MSRADPLRTSWKALSGDLWPSDVIPKIGSVGSGFSLPPAAARPRKAQLYCRRLCLLRRRNIRPIPSRMSIKDLGRDQPACHSH